MSTSVKYPEHDPEQRPDYEGEHDTPWHERATTIGSALVEGASFDARFECIMRVEQAALLVQDPACNDLEVFDTVEEFEHGINNFLLHFQGGHGEVYRLRPHYTRFEEEYTELAGFLNKQLRHYGGTFRELPWKTKEKLLYAHQIMTGLVDKEDPHARDGEGNIKPNFLNI